MKQKYDITLKSLIKDIPERLLDIVTGFKHGTFLDTSFEDVKLRQPDLLIRLPHRGMCHIEIQSDNDNTMLIRMLQYCNLIFERYGDVPEQVLLYVSNVPVRMKTSVTQRRLNYSYRLLDIRDIHCGDLLNSESPEDWILSILCGGGNAKKTIKSVLDRLLVLSHKQSRDSVLKLLILSRLRKLETW